MAKREVRDWESIVEKFLRSKNKTRTVKMGSPGSAQVTRCRLLQTYEDIEVVTKEDKLILKRAS